MTALSETLAEAKRLHQAGQLDRAEPLYRRHLQQQPTDATGLHLLGLLLLDRAQIEEAVQALTEAVQRDDAQPVFHYNLARASEQAGQKSEAQRHYQRAIELRPDFAEALDNLGTLVWESGKLYEAASWYRRALAVRPDLPGTHSNLGTVLAELGQKREALACFDAALALDPQHPQARFFRSTLTGDGCDQAPPDYVATLFDSHAASFDDEMEQLEYAVPKLLDRALKRVVSSEQASWRILDLGCGTGRCGRQFKPLASYLAGVDLAPRMIEEARNRGLYDDLHQGDLVEVLRSLDPAHTPLFDLVVAGDVFVYLGNLQPVLTQCHRWLAPGGLLVFSVEADDKRAYGLTESGRFTHSDDYLRQTAASLRFEVALLSEGQGRLQGGWPVRCFVAVLRKPIPTRTLPVPGDSRG